jgi:cytochrome c
MDIEAEICRMYKKMSIDQLADKFKMGNRRIRQILIDNGYLKYVPKPRAEISNSLRNKIKNSTEPKTVIAKKYGVSVRTVYNIKKETKSEIGACEICEKERPLSNENLCKNCSTGLKNFGRNQKRLEKALFWLVS